MEEILPQCGMGRKMKGFQYGKAFRQQMTQVGANDMIFLPTLRFADWQQVKLIL